MGHDRQLARSSAKNEALQARNDALDAEVRDLKQGLEAVEERARFELGMVRPDEVFFQIVDRRGSLPRGKSFAASAGAAPSFVSGNGAVASAVLRRSLTPDTEFRIQNTKLHTIYVSIAPPGHPVRPGPHRAGLQAPASMPICSGELAPGARLTQEELAASLSVSRQPVLQALRMLKRDGLAIDAGRRGLIVAPIDPALIEDLYEVRGVLEGLPRGSRRSPGRRSIPAWSSAGGRPLARGHFAALIDADIAFHNAIYAASGNPLIAESASRHWHHIRRAMGGVLQAAGPRDWVWDEHQAIVDAINTGDAPRAPSGARAQHCEAAGRVLATRLKTARPAAL